MDTPSAILGLTVLLVCIPASLWNLTGLALAIQWFVTTYWYYLTRIEFTNNTQFLLDAAVVAFIYIKPAEFECFPYANLREHLCAFWLELGYADRTVVALFALMWISYVSNLTAHQHWWILWVLAMLQYFAVGGDAVAKVLANRRKQRREKLHDVSSRLGFASYG